MTFHGVGMDFSGTTHWLFEHRPELFQKSPATYYFAKRDPYETTCGKITRLIILPN